MTEQDTASGSGQPQTDTASTQQVQSGAGDHVQTQNGPGITDYLSRPDVKHEIKYLIGIFAVIGLGFGLTGFVFNDILIGGATDSSSEGGSFVAGMLKFLSIVGILTMATMSGTLVSVFTSRELREKFDAIKPTYVAAATGNGAGYIVMMVVTALILSLTIDTGGGGSGGSGGGSAEGGVSLLNLGDLLVPIIALAIPVVIVSLATVYLQTELRYSNRANAAPQTAD